MFISLIYFIFILDTSYTQILNRQRMKNMTIDYLLSMKDKSVMVVDINAVTTTWLI